VAIEVAHLAVETLRQPFHQTGLSPSKIDIAYADLSEAQLRAPVLDVAC